MEQVLTSLFTNSIKYGSGRPVQIHRRAEDTRAALSVQDEGIRIGRLILLHIFGKSERLAASRSSRGLGLGLYVTPDG